MGQSQPGSVALYIKKVYQSVPPVSSFLEGPIMSDLERGLKQLDVTIRMTRSSNEKIGKLVARMIHLPGEACKLIIGKDDDSVSGSVVYIKPEPPSQNAQLVLDIRARSEDEVAKLNNVIDAVMGAYLSRLESREGSKDSKMEQWGFLELMA